MLPRLLSKIKTLKLNITLQKYIFFLNYRGSCTGLTHLQ